MASPEPPINDLIETLSDRLRAYIYRLKVVSDPAAIIQDNFRSREENAMPRAECERLAIAAGEYSGPSPDEDKEGTDQSSTIT